jgi:hypothetical protein
MLLLVRRRHDGTLEALGFPILRICGKQIVRI